MQHTASHRLLQLGILLFLLGLFTGLAVPAVANPRMGMASHVGGVTNGMFLVLLGLVWPRLQLAPPLLGTAFGLAVYAAFANWLATLLAAIWRAGTPMLPLAAQGQTGTPAQEAVLKALLMTLALAMVVACLLVLFGLRGSGRRDDVGA